MPLFESNFRRLCDCTRKCRPSRKTLLSRRLITLSKLNASLGWTYGFSTFCLPTYFWVSDEGSHGPSLLLLWNHVERNHHQPPEHCRIIDVDWGQVISQQSWQVSGSEGDSVEKQCSAYHFALSGHPFYNFLVQDWVITSLSPASSQFAIRAPANCDKYGVAAPLPLGLPLFKMQSGPMGFAQPLNKESIIWYKTPANFWISIQLL